MLNFREIKVAEALNMIANDDVDDLYFLMANTSINHGLLRVKQYKTTFVDLPKHRYFLLEEVENFEDD